MMIIRIDITPSRGLDASSAPSVGRFARTTA